MNLREKYDKHSCEECDEYTYVYEIKIGAEDEDDYGASTIYLCKKCLLKLFKLILER
jgi:hypothetical protein